MSKLYEDLTNIIDFELDKDEELYWDKDHKKMGIIFWVDIVMTAFVVFLIWTKASLGINLAVVFAVLNYIFIRNYQKKRFVPIKKHMNECSMGKVLTGYMYLPKYYKYNTKNSGVLLSNISNALFYLGKTEEAKKVVDLVDKYCDTPEGDGYRASVYTMIAMREKDKEKVKYYVNELEKLLPKTNAPYLTTAYKVVSQYPLLMEAEENGDYAKAKELLEKKDDELMYQKVGINYRLHKVAKAAGMEEEAEKHRAFVLANGGDTYFKKELQ